MSTVTKLILSGSTDGRGVKVVATATAGTLIHTAHATNLDELWLFGVNSDTVDRKLTMEMGGVTVPDDLVEFTVPAEDGLHLIVPGLILTGSVVIRAWAAAANVLVLYGYVNRIAP